MFVVQQGQDWKFSGALLGPESSQRQRRTRAGAANRGGPTRPLGYWGLWFFFFFFILKKTAFFQEASIKAGAPPL